MRDSRLTQARPISHLAVLVMILTASLSTIARGDDVSGPVTGEVRLASGRSVSYAAHLAGHFDPELTLRDSDTALPRMALIALTDRRAALLRFELPAIRLVRERIDLEGITCLGRGEGETVLAGFADGRVCRVDPVTLELTDHGQAPIRTGDWLGWKPASGQATRRFDRRDDGGTEDRRRRRRTLESAHVRSFHDLQAGTIRADGAELAVTTFLLDRARPALARRRQGRVGRLGRAGRFVEWKTHRDQAFAQSFSWRYQTMGRRLRFRRTSRRPGFGVWRHIAHGLQTRAVIARVDQAEPRRLFASDRPIGGAQKSDPGLPQLPITHIVEEDNGFLVLSYSDVFRVDPGFTSWKKAGETQDRLSLGASGRSGSVSVGARRASAAARGRCVFICHHCQRVCQSRGGEGNRAQHSRPAQCVGYC